MTLCWHNRWCFYIVGPIRVGCDRTGIGVFAIRRHEGVALWMWPLPIGLLGVVPAEALFKGIRYFRSFASIAFMAHRVGCTLTSPELIERWILQDSSNLMIRSEYSPFTPLHRPQLLRNANPLKGKRSVEHCVALYLWQFFMLFVVIDHRTAIPAHRAHCNTGKF